MVTGYFRHLDAGADLFSIVPDYLARYRAARGEDSLSPEDEAHIKSALNKLHSLPGTYSFTVLQLVPDMTEEEVSQVFVRVNSMGKRLNQADFILTLMSVYWDTGRHELERFAREEYFMKRSNEDVFIIKDK